MMSKKNIIAIIALIFCVLFFILPDTLSLMKDIFGVLLALLLFLLLFIDNKNKK